MLNALVQISLLGYVPFSLLFFAIMPAPRAVASALIMGWLFLPPAVRFPILGLPDYDKYFAIAFAAAFGAIVFDSKRILAFRPAWFDIPMLLFLVLPGLTSISNGLGFNDALSTIFRQLTYFAIPYFLARVYFSSLAGMRELLLVIFVSGLIYAPLVVYELRFSPQLNRMLYGYHQHSFGQTKRYGGFRPMVFMQHGLMLSLWMCCTTVAGLMLWMSGSVRKLMSIPISVLVTGVGLVAVGCRSFGALSLMVIAMIVAYAARQLKLPVIITIMALVPLAYISLRVTELWDGSQLVTMSGLVGGDERAGSLEFRLRSENVLNDRAWKRPLLGWGGHSRSRGEADDAAAARLIVDGWWLILFGQRGLLGMGAWLIAMTLPVLLFIHRWKAWAVWHPWLLPGLGLCLILVMFVIDCMFNAMLNPLYILCAGAVAGLAPTPQLIKQMQAAIAPPPPPAQQALPAASQPT